MQSREKCSVSIILAILANCQKLSLFVIFKDKTNNYKLINLLNVNYYVKNKKIFYDINDNICCNTSIMEL